MTPEVVPVTLDPKFDGVLAQRPENTTPAPSIEDIVVFLTQNKKWQVFPLHTANPANGLCTCGNEECKDQGKHPRTANGFRDSSSSPDQIHQWWSRWSNANIGISTGYPNFIVVLDIDPRHDGDKSLERLENEYGKLPGTFTVKTGGGGFHYYFSRFAGIKIKSLSNALGDKYPGLDVKGEGGYVVGPGSRHVSGGYYTIVNDADLVDVPEWLEKLITNGPNKAGTILRSPDHIQNGTRNNTLYRIACSMANKGLSDDAVLAALREENKAKCNPALDDSEIEAIVNSACSFVREHPPSLQLQRPDCKISDGHELLDNFTRITGKDNIVLDHGPIAAYLHEVYHTISFNKMLFIYDKDKGIYRQNAGDLEEAIRHIIESTGAKCSITRDTRDILAYLAATNRSLTYPFNQSKDAIPLKNGILKLNFSTGMGILIPHSPGYLFTFQIPIEYNPKADGEIFHKTVLSQYVESDNIDALYQIPAQAILQSLGIGPFKKSYILQGNADGGKTSYLAWLHAILGLENIGHVSLHQIGTDPFVNADLESRILNTFDDLADVPLQNIGPFKAMTGGFDFPINKKHMQRYNGRIFAVHVFTCNAPPDVPEKILFDSAFWTRWEYLHFDNVFPIDPTFITRTFTPDNISGSFNRVIKMVFKIAKDGLAVNNTPSDVKDIWQLAADPFAQFISEHMTPSSDDHKFDKEYLLVSFQAYCREKEINDRKVPSSQKGLTALAFKNGFKDARVGKKTERRWVYTAHRNWHPGSKYREGTNDS